MAIDADVIGTGPELSLPPVFVKHISAAGFVDLDTDAELLTINNFSGSQMISVRLNADADNTAADPADPLSVRIDVGQSASFKIAALDAAGYKLSIV